MCLGEPKCVKTTFINIVNISLVNFLHILGVKDPMHVRQRVPTIGKFMIFDNKIRIKQ